jgi:putative tricarboxylic transport membrane protein
LGIWLKRRKARLEATPTLVPTGAIAAVDEREPEKS